MKTKLVKDIMLPIDEYAIVTEDATIYDAFLALEEAQKKVKPGKQPHRAVLVKDKNNKIVGKLGHLGFLRALEPGYQNLGQLDVLSKAGLTKDFITSMMKNYDLFQDELDDIRHRTKSSKIKDVMRTVTEHIDINEPLNEAVHKIIMWQTLSILVTKDDDVVGILRLSDLYDEINKIILDK